MYTCAGNNPWPIGVTSIGIHERSSREKISHVMNGAAHIMNDEATRKYLQAVKRLLTFLQRAYPTDPSRSVDFDGFRDAGLGAKGAGSDKAVSTQAIFSFGCSKLLCACMHTWSIFAWLELKALAMTQQSQCQCCPLCMPLSIILLQVAIGSLKICCVRLKHCAGLAISAGFCMQCLHQLTNELLQAFPSWSSKVI